MPTDWNQDQDHAERRMPEKVILCMHSDIEPLYIVGNDGNPHAVQCRRCFTRWRVVPHGSDARATDGPAE